MTHSRQTATVGEPEFENWLAGLSPEARDYQGSLQLADMVRDHCSDFRVARLGDITLVIAMTTDEVTDVYMDMLLGDVYAGRSDGAPFGRHQLVRAEKAFAALGLNLYRIELAREHAVACSEIRDRRLELVLVSPSLTLEYLSSLSVFPFLAIASAAAHSQPLVLPDRLPVIDRREPRRPVPERRGMPVIFTWRFWRHDLWSRQRAASRN